MQESARPCILKLNSNSQVGLTVVWKRSLGPKPATKGYSPVPHFKTPEQLVLLLETLVRKQNKKKTQIRSLGYMNMCR